MFSDCAWISVQIPKGMHRNNVDIVQSYIFGINTLRVKVSDAPVPNGDWDRLWTEVRQTWQRQWLNWSQKSFVAMGWNPLRTSTYLRWVEYVSSEWLRSSEGLICKTFDMCIVLHKTIIWCNDKLPNGCVMIVMGAIWFFGSHQCVQHENMTRHNRSMDDTHYRSFTSGYYEQTNIDTVTKFTIRIKTRFRLLEFDNGIWSAWFSAILLTSDDWQVILWIIRNVFHSAYIEIQITLFRNVFDCLRPCSLKPLWEKWTKSTGTSSQTVACPMCA